MEDTCHKVHEAIKDH